MNLVEKVGIFLKKLKEKGCKIPIIALSCDNGYNSAELKESCQNASLAYISVPKKTDKIEVNGVVYKIKDYIETVFLVEQTAYEEEAKGNPEINQSPFYQRVRANYYSKNITNAVFLFFRFNGSKKVSVIYCPDKNIFAKTLRHHFFQRTQIEQFFRLLKHSLQIAQAKTTTKHEFELKLLRFNWVALHTQLLTRYLRKKLKQHTKYGFERFRRLIIAQLGELDILKQLLI